MMPSTTIAVAYAEGCRDGTISVCGHVKMAAERWLRDLAEAEAATSPWAYHPELVEAAVTFISALPIIKGASAGTPMHLLPWQVSVLANLFGFTERGSLVRRFRQGVVFVPKGNGKSAFAAGIALYCSFAEGEGGAEGYAAAVTRDQARIVFDTAREMVKRSQWLRRDYGLVATAHAISQPETASKLVPISSDAKALDGLNLTFGVLDEIASHKTPEVYGSLITAMGKRLSPLLLSISTATEDTAGIGKELWDYTLRVLRGEQDDERLFGVIYTADDADDPWDEATWRKANPSWGHAGVQPDGVRANMAQARNNPAREANMRSRHLNLWIGANEALFSMAAWRACASDLRIEDFEGEECIIGIDLAFRTDLAALVVTFPTYPPGEEVRYTTFAEAYLNEQAVKEARNAAYPAWAAQEHLTVTPGNETDFARIEADVLECCRRFNVRSVVYDPAHATQFAQRLTDAGAPMEEFTARTINLSEPTKELAAAMQAGRIQHDGNPVLAWCVGNVVGHLDARDNVYPRKARPENKIDLAFALIMTIGASMAEPDMPKIWFIPN